MGTCSCSCLSDKSEKPLESNNELKSIEKPLVSADKLDKSTQSDLISVSLTEVASKPLSSNPENPPKISQSTANPNSGLQRTQALFRGYLTRKAYITYKPLQPQAIPEVPSTISTFEARQAYARLAPFKFEKPAGDEPVNWKGPTKLIDGSVYVGEWNNKGFPHGKGVMYYIDGGICEGYWSEGKLHDKGRRVSPKGDIYTGSWNNGKMQGQGVMEYASKSTYDGGWLNDKHHGFGIETWPDKSRFEGYYKDGLKAGRGKFYWADGTKYEGEFENDVINGVGKYTWINKEYEGGWKEGKMHGKGVFKWADGKVYEGEYYNDTKCGYGVLKWPNGKRYEGLWRDGKFHGQGVMIQKGKKRVGLWENGEFKQKLRA